MKLRIIDPLSMAVAVMLLIMLGIQLEQWVAKKMEEPAPMVVPELVP